MTGLPPGRGRISAGAREGVALLAATADLMHDLEWFWIRARSLSRSRLERLFGFPVRPGGRWEEQPPDVRHAVLRADMQAFAAHLRSMPDSSRRCWERATERCEREYGRRSEACTRIWVPVYEFLVANDLSDIRSRPVDLRAVCLPPGVTGKGA